MGYLDKNSKKWIYNDGSINGIIVSGTTLKKEGVASIISNNLDIPSGTTFNDDTNIALQTNVFAPQVESMMFGDTLDLDCENKNFFDIYLNRDVTRINLPTNVINGLTYRVQIRQDAVGGRAIQWGNKDTFTGLNVSINTGMGGTIILYIHSGTFDWSVLRDNPGRKSYIQTEGFVNNVNNFDGMKVSSFDESAGTITLEGANWDFIDENTVAGISISVENPFYFTDEMNDIWIGQFPFGVTQFTFYSTSDGGSALLTKEGVYSNTMHQRAKIRFEEELTDDFVSGSDNGLLEWREAASNGSVNTTSSDVDGNHPGGLSIKLNGSATADGRASTSLGTDMFNLSDMRIGTSGIIKGNANSFSTADVIWYCGFSDSNQPQSTADGMYFEIIADGAGNGRVHCVGEIGGAKTTYDTGVDLVEDDWFVLHIGKPSHSGTVHFAVNDIVVYEMAQSTIGFTNKLTPIFGGYYDYTGTPLPNNKQLFIDGFSMKYRMSSDRI